MTAEENLSGCRVSPSPVEKLNENDVLLGRGSGANVWIGNVRFRDIVKERKTHYISARKNKLKKEIANEVFQRVRSRGGRFLQLPVEEGANPVVSVVEESVWYECSVDVALEKCKQALRQNRKDKPNAANLSASDDVPTLHQNEEKLADASRSGTSDIEEPLLDVESSTPSASYDAGLPAGVVSLTEFVTIPPSANSMPTLPPALSRCISSQAAIAPWLLLYQTTPSLACQPYYRFNQATIAPQLYPYTSQVSLRIQPQHIFSGTYLPPIPLHCTEQGASYPVQAQPYPYATQVNDEVSDDSAMKGKNDVPGSNFFGTMIQGQGTGEPARKSTKIRSVPNTDLPPVETDENVSEFVLSALGLSGRQKFTEEQRMEEKANMTDHERARLLADLFGKYCSTQQTKKCRKGLKKDDITFLVKQMKVELEQIPKGKKDALMEAQVNCPAEEFSDARLERFLRCEGMDVTRGAQRFVNYWECRRQVFGRDKYLMSMTLSEALRDDLVALETGVFCWLPRRDLSGRRILYLDPSRHTREAYTSESLLRAIWYVIELTSLENNDVSSGFVQMVWLKHTSIFDYDVKIYDRMHYFDMSAWPMRSRSFHICCPQSSTLRIVIPILFAAADKESRTRAVFHTVPEKDLLAALSEYGIDKNMVPKHMGGMLEFDQKLWIEDRRAMEMEEI